MQARDPQNRDAEILDLPLPGNKFFLRKFIAMASFLETEGAAARCSDNRSLAPCDPVVRVCGRQVDSAKIWVRIETPQTPTKIFIEAGPATALLVCARSRFRFAPLSRKHFLPSLNQ